MSSPEPPPRITELLNAPLLLSVAAETLAGALVAGASLRTPRPYLVVVIAVLLFGAGQLLERYFEPEDERTPPYLRGPRPNPARERIWRFALAVLVAAAFLVSILSVLRGSGGRDVAAGAVGVMLCVVLYAAGTREIWGAGFVTLGAARGLNFLLGASAEPLGLAHYAWLALPVAVYATGWAVLRSAQDRGAPPATPYIALIHLAAGFAIVVYQLSTGADYLAEAVPFWLALLPLVLPRLVRATMDPRPGPLKEAVRWGLVGLALLEAALAAGHAHWWAGLLVALLGFGVYTFLRPAQPA